MFQMLIARLTRSAPAEASAPLPPDDDFARALKRLDRVQPKVEGKACLFRNPQKRQAA